MTGRGRVSDQAVLRWCFEPQRYCTDEMFNPFIRVGLLRIVELFDSGCVASTSIREPFAAGA